MIGELQKQTCCLPQHLNHCLRAHAGVAVSRANTATASAPCSEPAPLHICDSPCLNTCVIDTSVNRTFGGITNQADLSAWRFHTPQTE